MLLSLELNILSVPERIAWYKEHLMIRPKKQPGQRKSRLIPFELNPIQEELEDYAVWCYANGVPVRMIALKARQEGVSTWTEGHIFLQGLLLPEQEAFIVAQDEDATQNLQAMYKRFWEYLPNVAQPALNRSNRRGMEFEHNRSKIYCFTAGKGKAAGRSFNPTHLHASEVDFWPDPRRFYDAMSQGIADEPWTFEMFESTADGPGLLMNEMWDEAVAGRNQYKPFFFAWHKFPDYKRIPTYAELLQYGGKEWVNKNRSLIEASRRRYGDHVSPESLPAGAAPRVERVASTGFGPGRPGPPRDPGVPGARAELDGRGGGGAHEGAPLDGRTGPPFAVGGDAGPDRGGPARHLPASDEWSVGSRLRGDRRDPRRPALEADAAGPHAEPGAARDDDGPHADALAPGGPGGAGSDVGRDAAATGGGAGWMVSGHRRSELEPVGSLDGNVPDLLTLFDASLSNYELSLLAEFSLARDQIAWLRWCVPNKCRNDPTTRRREYPSRADEAFQAASAEVLDLRVLAEWLVEAKTYPKIQASFHGFQTVDGKIRVEPQPNDENGGWEIYEWPTVDRRIIGFLDSAQGIGEEVEALDKLDDEGDWHVCYLMDLVTGNQVGEYRTKVDTDLMIDQVEYGCLFWKVEVLAIEINGGWGITALRHFLDRKTIPVWNRRTQDKRTREYTDKPGWSTDSKSRPGMVSESKLAVRNRDCLIRSVRTIRECMTLEQGPTGKVAARKGLHDDGWMAYGGLSSMRADLLGNASAAREAERKRNSKIARLNRMVDRESKQTNTIRQMSFRGPLKTRAVKPRKVVRRDGRRSYF